MSGKSIALSTKSGIPIPNEQMPEDPPSRRRDAVALIETVFKDKLEKLKLRSISATYNCAGLVFAQRRTSIYADDLTPIVIRILYEDGYRRLDEKERPFPGDIIVYRDSETTEITHVGFVLEVGADIQASPPRFSTLVLSKWGALGEYIHPDIVKPDAYGERLEYWSERKGTDDP